MCTSSLQTTCKEERYQAPVLDRKLSEGDSILITDHTAVVLDPKYTGDYQIVSFPENTIAEVVDLMGKVKIVHISDVKYVLPADTHMKITQ